MFFDSHIPLRTTTAAATGLTFDNLSWKLLVWKICIVFNLPAYSFKKTRLTLDLLMMDDFKVRFYIFLSPFYVNSWLEKGKFLSSQNFTECKTKHFWRAKLSSTSTQMMCRFETAHYNSMRFASNIIPLFHRAFSK